MKKLRYVEEMAREWPRAYYLHSFLQNRNGDSYGYEPYGYHERKPKWLRSAEVSAVGILICKQEILEVSSRNQHNRGKPVLLGSYKSNDRAQEVMEWIVKEYEKQLSPNTVSIRMPQE